MILSELRTAVRTRLGRPSNDAFFTDAILNDFINEANQAISVEGQWPWLQTSEVITTVANTQSYTPAASWNFTRMLFITEFADLTYVPLETLVNYVGVGQPEVYTVTENKIKFGPIPGSVFAINHIFYKIEPIMASDSDTPILPVQFQYAIVELALSYAYQRANQPDMHNIARGTYGEWLHRMQDYKRRTSGPLRPKTRRSY